MTPREQGFLLLTAHLGDPERKPLTIPQFRELALCVQTMERPKAGRELTETDLLALGYNHAFAGRILYLLSQTEQLQWYLEAGRKRGCVPITRISEDYPQRVRKKLGLDAPGVLWAKGDIRILQKPAVALVGSRELREENREFARRVGKQAARQGFVLVSGDARGADRAAQDSCLEHGGSVISIVCDRLEKHPAQERTLYLSEDGFDLAFSAQRALLRNRIIHSLGSRTFVAQSAWKKGGTWDGTCKNLRFGFSPVFCFHDGSDAVRELEQLGATLIAQKELEDINALQPEPISFIDQ